MYPRKRVLFRPELDEALLRSRSAQALAKGIAQSQALATYLAAGSATIDFLNGSDANDGVLAPLKTWGSLIARVGPSVLLPSNLTVQLLNGPNAPSDRITWDVTVVNGARFVLKGGTTQLASDTLTSVTARARSTNTPWQLGSASGFGGSLTHQSLRVASKNARLWIDAALDSTHARITEPVALQTPPTSGFGGFPAKIATLATNDAYVVESMMPIYMGDFTVHGQMRQQTSQLTPPGTVTLYQLQALNPYTGHGHDEILLSSDGLAQTGTPQFLLQECRIDTAIRFEGDGAMLINCRTTGPVRGRPDAPNAQVRGPIFFAGGSTGFDDVVNGGSLIDHKFDASSIYFEGDWILSGATLYVYGTTTRVGAIGIFDCDDGIGIELQAGAVLYMDATAIDPTGPAIWGDAHSHSQGAGTGINFHGCSRIAYSGSANNLTLTSSGGSDFVFGASSTGFAVDPTTNALSAAIALSWSNFQKSQATGGFGGVCVRNDTQNSITPTPAVNI